MYLMTSHFKYGEMHDKVIEVFRILSYVRYKDREQGSMVVW